MDDKIAKIIKKHYPKIANGFDVPVWAIVTTINENVTAGALSDRFRARYAASVKLLNSAGIDIDAPILENIALAGTFSNGAGLLVLPEPGSIVEMSFAFGDIDKPYISKVLPFTLDLPGVKTNETTLQSRPGVAVTMQQNGDIKTETDRAIKQISQMLEQITGHQKLSAISQEIEIESHSVNTVNGTYQLNALGALLLLTTGHVELSALESLNLTTASDLNENIAERRRAVIGKLLSYIVKESELKLDESGFLVDLKSGGVVNIGNADTNLSSVLSQIISIVSSLATALSGHKHDSNTGLPVNMVAIKSIASNADDLGSNLAPIVP